MTQKTNKTNQSGPDIIGVINTDVVQPFLLENADIRGRMVRLDQSLNDILSAHDYAPSVARTLAESLTLTTLLAGMLKYDGVFTLQTTGDGPVKTMVSDMTNTGQLRGYAIVDDEKLDALETDDPLPRDMTGKGYMAFTVDQKNSDERYQGLVELKGDQIVDSVQHYFKQSEQLKVGIKIFTQQGDDGKWSGGAIMLQNLPPSGERLANDDTDAWRRCMMLLDTATKHEMLDADLPVNDMIYRLFNEENIRVYDPIPINHQCRCSRDRVESVLKNFNQTDLTEFIIDGILSMDCEFCSTHYEFTEQDLKELFNDKDV